MNFFYRVLVTFVIGYVLDWGSKAWAEQNLTQYEPVEVIGEFFRFTLGYNTGVAFGLFTNSGNWPLILTGVVITGLIIWFFYGARQGQFPMVAGWPIGLLLSGAIGNFTDRLGDGRVTDFLDVGLGASRWPTFNVADSFILLGLAWFMLTEARYTEPEPEPDPIIDTDLSMNLDGDKPL